jgi:transcriptional regulator with XRE-family HTH domain
MKRTFDFIPSENASRLDYIRGLLVLRRVDRRKIQNQLGITPGTISHILAGKIKSLRVQRALAEALDMSFEDVWGYPESHIQATGVNGSILQRSANRKKRERG